MQWRRVIRVTAIVLTALVVPVAVGAVGIAGVGGDLHTQRCDCAAGLGGGCRSTGA
jgi:hypothetical protein